MRSRNSACSVGVLCILKEDGLLNGDGVCLGFISFYPVGEKKCKTFFFISHSILLVGFSQAALC